MKPFITSACAMMLTMCATTSTEGLSKDQIANREKDRTAWSEFGRAVLRIAVNTGVGAFSNGPRTDGFSKDR